MHKNDDFRLVWICGKPYYWTTDSGRYELKRVVTSLRPPADPLDTFRGPLPWPPR